MNKHTIPLKPQETLPIYEINKLTDELLTNFKISGKKISTKNRNILTEILDFVVEAEQTIAMQNSRIEKLEVMTTTDPLTGLLNRRGIKKELEHAVATADRYGETAIFAYIDLDGFKDVNDVFGHDVGDAELKFVADTLLSTIRQTDYAARLGGDEFALLLRHSEFSGGKERTRFIQQKLNFTKFKYNDHTLPIRASFGIAEICSGSTVENIMKNADRQMYNNKNIRRSR